MFPKHKVCPLSRAHLMFLVSLIILCHGYICVRIGQVGRQGLHVLVHGLGHIFAVGHGLDYRPAPLTASPLAKMPGMLVRPTSSVSNRPRGVVLRSLVLSVMVVQGPWLIETITLSAG